MTREVLIQAGAGEIRVAVTQSGRLEELTALRTFGTHDGGSARCCTHIGDIVLGRVLRVMPAMQAAFVDIGSGRAGFLAGRDARARARGKDEIGACVHEGEALLVQIVKDPIGKKGARLSAHITLPGRLVILAPGRLGIAVSRDAEGEATRARLMSLGKILEKALAAEGADCGYILRTVAAEAAFPELLEDTRLLAATWRGILEKAKKAAPPATLYRDLAPVECAMRDLVRADTARVVIDDTGAAEAARAYCRRAMPRAEEKIVLFDEAGTLFDAYGLEDEIAGLAEPRVTLPSGGWITIEATQALTAIDVNSGSFQAASSREETALVVNLEAAGEIGRQLRLRGLGGLIVVDFIQMNALAYFERIAAALAQSLALDRAPVRISPLPELGIVAIARWRLRDPPGILSRELCRPCAGTGHRRTSENIALEILRRVERAAKAAPGKEILVRAAGDVVDWLNDHGEDVRGALERRGVGRVRFEASDILERETYDVGTA